MDNNRNKDSYKVVKEIMSYVIDSTVESILQKELAIIDNQISPQDKDLIIKQLSDELIQKEETIRTLRGLLEFQKNPMRAYLNGSGDGRKPRSSPIKKGLFQDCIDIVGKITDDTLPKLFEDEDSTIDNMKVELLNIMEHQLNHKRIHVLSIEDEINEIQIEEQDQDLIINRLAQTDQISNVINEYTTEDIDDELFISKSDPKDFDIMSEASNVSGIEDVEKLKQRNQKLKEHLKKRESQVSLNLVSLEHKWVELKSKFKAKIKYLQIENESLRVSRNREELILCQKMIHLYEEHEIEQETISEFDLIV